MLNAEIGWLGVVSTNNLTPLGRKLQSGGRLTSNCTVRVDLFVILERNTVYEHELDGEVLLLGVHHTFSRYDATQKDGTLAARVVQYATDWDAYGPMPSNDRIVSVDEFTASIGDPIRTVEFDPAE